ncbi:hypothetical protein EST38_g6473 [Candolleomyces aberdarensis]|uniref:Protein kinase domain-containing protein n=1 Tax=Candolleomyces aberdarensis TaxID=2316362 RepID=A0A4Q2DKW1_9AGAR|nr:hypothetical protein EST38_g6473 [Candolleomyces aberdarensis]
MTLTISHGGHVCVHGPALVKHEALSRIQAFSLIVRPELCSKKMENPEYTLAMLNNLYGDNALKVPFRLDRTDRPGRPYSVISYGTIQDQGKSRLVVLKTYRQINGTTVQKVAQRTYREVKILVALHDPPGLCPNINRFYGVLFPDPAQIREAIVGIPSIVVDFVKYDSLEYTEGKDFGLRLSIQLGNGLLYMHSLGLVHGDLKPDNFRVTEDGVVKIIDLGLGRYETNEHTGLTTLILPCYRFTAPELIIPNMDAVSMFVTKATDVYAFSMTALQVLDGREYQKSIPFNQHWVPFAVRRAIVNQEWPQAQHYTGVTPEAWGVISACWTTDPSVRPRIDTILKQLSGIALSL